MDVQIVRSCGSVVIFIVLVGILSTGCGQLDPTLTPPSVRSAGWEHVSINTVCLAVEESYSYQPEPDEFLGHPKFDVMTRLDPELWPSKPFAESAESVLQEMGMEVVTTESPCDATLTLHVLGEVYGHWYFHGLGETDWLYTNPTYRIEATLSANGRQPVEVTVRHGYLLPDKEGF